MGGLQTINSLDEKQYSFEFNSFPFIDIDKVTDADLEKWLTKDMTTQDILDIEIDSQPELIRTDMMDSWIVHYDRNA